MKTFSLKKHLLIAVFIGFCYSSVAQGVTSVNNETGSVSLNLSLNGDNLSLTGGNTVSLPVGGSTLWSQQGTNIFTAVAGNVGIGTSSPDEKLTVSGNILAREVIVELNAGGADYVFEKGYPLMDIRDLEGFIRENKHLPEIPSANEMEINGINLSEMNILILKKTEELALYIINHEKRLNKLERKEQHK